MTLHEIYLEFRTAPVSSLSVGGSLYRDGSLCRYSNVGCLHHRLRNWHGDGLDHRDVFTWHVGHD